LILSAESRGVVLQHAPGRVFHEDQEHLANRIAPLDVQIDLVERFGARVLAITLNDERVAPAEREAIRARIESETGLPAVWSLHEGAARLVPVLSAHVQHERRA
jgi:uncharacterized NAD-dependent epimerase/dehydratase family protein